MTQWEALVLTFNDLLTLQGVDPTQVRLVRHQDRRLRAGRLYEAWRKDRAAFEAYQSAQVRNVFPIDAMLASFIVTTVPASSRVPNSAPRLTGH